MDALSLFDGKLYLLLFAIVILGLVFSLLLYTKHNLAGALCFLAPMPLYWYVNALGIHHTGINTITSIVLSFISILPFIIFALLMFIKAKNILFLIPTALIFIPHIMADWIYPYDFMHTLGGINVGVHMLFSGSFINIGNTLVCIAAFVPLLVSCLAGRKIKFFAYSPFIIYATLTLMLLCYYTYTCILHDKTIRGIEVIIPSMLILSAALFCLGKHIACETASAKAKTKKTTAPQTISRQTVPDYKNQNNDLVPNYPTGNNYKSQSSNNNTSNITN